MSKKPKLFEFFRTWVSSAEPELRKIERNARFKPQADKIFWKLAFLWISEALGQFLSITAACQRTLASVAPLTRQQSPHTPQRAQEKDSFSCRQPHNKGRNGRFHLPYKDTKNFWNDQIFHAGNDPFFARFCKSFCFCLPRLHTRHFCHIVTLSHWGYISVRCLLPCRRWPPGSALISPKTLLVTLSHCCS